MAASPDSVSIAMFCDFENVALGVRDAKFDKFDIKPVLERLLLKGSIVVKKAYCDWDRYKTFKSAMHEANFELIEIPHVRQSGKNSADIRMVVDALDLCYTKSHVDTFVIVSGDSDFSPLVSKLRENAKHVIGVGVKQSTSDLLIANCDEFIFYDDLVRESQRAVVRRDPKAVQTLPRLSPEEWEARKAEAIELAIATFEALVVERGDSGKIWSSMLTEAMKRRKPDFNESHFGFRSFGNLLEEAQTRGLLEIGRDEKSGAFVSRSSAPVPVAEVSPLAAQAGAVVDEKVAGAPEGGEEAPATVPAQQGERRGRNRNKRNSKEPRRMNSEPPVTAVESAANEAPLAQSEIPPSTPHTENSPPENQRKGQKQVRVSDIAAAPESSSVSPVNPTEQGDFPPDVEISPTSAGGAVAKPKKPRGRGTRKAKAGSSAESAGASGNSEID